MEIIKKIFVSLAHMFIGFASVFGGLRLIVSNGMGYDLAWLDGSIFHSFYWPGVILAAVVGGTQIFAVLVIFLGGKFWRWTSFIASLGIIIWTFFQIYIIKEAAMFQIVFFSLGIFTLILSFLPGKKVAENQVMQQ